MDDGPSWAKYMSISGSPDDEYDIINMQYTEEGLLTVDENRDGRAAAFGDDIAIECLATEFKREIFVVICCLIIFAAVNKLNIMSMSLAYFVLTALPILLSVASYSSYSRSYL